MRILLWHGYLLGGTGSNVYTRMLAREWSSAGHDVTVLSQEPHPERYDLGARDVAATGRRAACCRSSSSTATRATTCGCVQDCTRDELDGWVEANAAAVRDAPPGRRRLHEPRAPRRAGRGGDGSAVRRQGARLRARVLDARQRRALGLGSRSARRRARDVRRLGAHPRGPGRGLRAHRATSSRCRPGSTSTSGRRSRATRRSPACSRRRGAIAPNPGNAEERLPDDGNAARFDALPRRPSDPSSSTSAS